MGLLSGDAERIEDTDRGKKTIQQDCRDTLNLSLEAFKAE
jgi:hypothetical protein